MTIVAFGQRSIQAAGHPVATMFVVLGGVKI
jgi:hypothetical protein